MSSWNDPLGSLVVVYAIVSVLAVLQCLLMLLATYENVRFFRSRLRCCVPGDFTPRVELFVPCKGLEPSFNSMVDSILRQDYPAYAATFVVESASDAAYERLRQLLANRSAARTRLLVAGPSRDCGQKVHNLLAATAQADAAAEVFAFVDSDTVLEKDWLRRLVCPLRKRGIGAVTGYRWFIPQAGDWPGKVLAALNDGLAFTLGNHGWNPVWGGSWAMRRHTFEALKIRSAWKGALTEDLPIGPAVRRAGMRVAFEPGCLVASPVRGSWRGLAEFARRQYLITRVYAPGLWWFGMANAILSNAVLWGGIALALWCWTIARPVAWIGPLLVILCGMNAVRARLRQRAVSVRFAHGQERVLRSIARLELWAQPLLALGNCVCLLSSALGREITWRNIRYHLHGPHCTEILSRPDPD
jgi:ceramide glucosyltransferase